MPYLAKFLDRKKELNIKNAEIAALSNIPLSTVNRFFSGEKTNPSFANVAGIATVLGISLDELAGLKEPNESEINSRVEATMISYAELLKERDIRIEEKDSIIQCMKEDKKKYQKEKSLLLGTIVSLAAVIAFFLLFDLMNGHFGYFRY